MVRAGNEFLHVDQEANLCGTERLQGMGRIATRLDNFPL